MTKKWIGTFKSSGLPIARTPYRLFYNVKHFGKLLLNSGYRSQYVTKWRFRDNYFQKEFYTKPNRYPHLFSECKSFLSSTTNPQILSFGCATGGEVFTIGSYIPNASVSGVDINNWCLKQCKKKNADRRFSFFHRFSEEFNNCGNFDAIFCLAVFQQTENRSEARSAATEFTFEKFEEEVSMLDKKLKRNGLFILDNADFSFMDTRCSAGYRPLDFEKNKILRQRPLFDMKNHRVADIQENYRIFLKL